MCLAIPMRLVEIDRFEALCEARGVERRISLFLLQHETFALGDMVMVHGGYAMQKMTEEEARVAWELYDQILEETGMEAMPEAAGNS